MIIWCNECYGGGQPIPCDNGSLDEHRSLRHHGKPYLPEEPHLPPEYDDDEDEEDWVEITGSMVRGRQVEPERPAAPAVRPTGDPKPFMLRVPQPPDPVVPVRTVVPKLNGHVNGGSFERGIEDAR